MSQFGSGKVKTGSNVFCIPLNFNKARRRRGRSVPEEKQGVNLHDFMSLALKKFRIGRANSTTTKSFKVANTTGFTEDMRILYKMKLAIKGAKEISPFENFFKYPSKPKKVPNHPTPVSSQAIVTNGSVHYTESKANVHHEMRTRITDKIGMEILEKVYARQRQNSSNVILIEGQNVSAKTLGEATTTARPIIDKPKSDSHDGSIPKVNVDVSLSDKGDITLNKTLPDSPDVPHGPNNKEKTRGRNGPDLVVDAYRTERPTTDTGMRPTTDTGMGPTTDTGMVIETQPQPPTMPIPTTTPLPDLMRENVAYARGTRKYIPCSVCQATGRVTSLVIPSKTRCPSGWKKEYQGYLMAFHYDTQQSELICVDKGALGVGPNTDPGIAEIIENYMVHVMVDCSSLPCPPLIEEEMMVCSVCTL